VTSRGDASCLKSVGAGWLLGASTQPILLFLVPNVTSASDLLQRAKTALAGRYTIERELGLGGTAIVFLAHDPKHDRKVALKVLLPEIAMAIGAERFQREITIAAKLNHPHILPLHDSGEAGGLLYYVMPFVQGESLRDCIARKKQLPVEDAIRIGVEVASALDRAHSEGVVHRDIKPENILLEGGYAIVADFGIARARSEADGGAITQTGMVVGTPKYMSPEQAVGAPDLDGRSDLYSLACVVYEMLAGTPPFKGASFHEIIAHHAMAPVPSVRVARPDAPEHVDHALVRALAKSPAQRFESLRDFAHALTTPAASQASPAAADGFWGKVRSVFSKQSSTPAFTPSATFGIPSQTPSAQGVPSVGIPRAETAQLRRSIPSPVGMPTPLITTPSGRPPIDSLAVLPFTNSSNDPDGEYLSEGITETVMNKLAGVAGLRVVPRSVVFRYKGRDVDATQVGQELKVRAVVTGRIQHRGDMLIIKVELVDAVSEAQLWGEQYNRKMSDIFAVQEEMAAEITRSLRLTLSGKEQRDLVKRFTDNTQAYQAYLRGRHHWNKRTVEGLRQALVHFQQAIDHDANYALAYTGLADTFNILGYYNNQRPHDAYPKGKAAAARALAIDDTLAEAHASMGYVRLFYDLDFEGARQCFARALELNPTYATTHHWYAWYLFVVERFDDALAELEQAQALDPLSLIINDHLGYALLLSGKVSAALDQLVKARELDPAFPWTYWRLGSVYFAMHRYDEAIDAFSTVVEKTDGGVGLGFLGLTYAAAQRTGEARAVIERLDRLAKTRYVSPLDYAMVHAGLGNVDAALDALERSHEDRVSDFARVKLLPWPEAVRSDARFASLTKNLGGVSRT
jgi:serine/threonine protein kinase/tetratricopeptide (TPR) repeat protein